MTLLAEPPTVVRCRYPGCNRPLHDPDSVASGYGSKHDPNDRHKPRRVSARQAGPDLLTELEETMPDPRSDQIHANCREAIRGAADEAAIDIGEGSPPQQVAGEIAIGFQEDDKFGRDYLALLLAVAIVELAKVQAEVKQLTYERRLLGFARMTLDAVAARGPEWWDQVRVEAEDVAQRIVDEIGHPVTDEPALGPSFRERIAELEAQLADVARSASWFVRIDRDERADGETRTSVVLHESVSDAMWEGMPPHVVVNGVTPTGAEHREALRDVFALVPVNPTTEGDRNA